MVAVEGVGGWPVGLIGRTRGAYSLMAPLPQELDMQSISKRNWDHLPKALGMTEGKQCLYLHTGCRIRVSLSPNVIADGPLLLRMTPVTLRLHSLRHHVVSAADSAQSFWLRDVLLTCCRWICHGFSFPYGTIRLIY